MGFMYYTISSYFSGGAPVFGARCLAIEPWHVSPGGRCGQPHPLRSNNMPCTHAGDVTIQMESPPSYILGAQ